MRWFRNFNKALEEHVLRDPNFERDSTTWGGWAAEHGWTYQSEAPELVGRYWKAVPSGTEHYCHLLTTRLHGLRVMAFEQRSYAAPTMGEDTYARFLSFIVWQLPGLPPAEFIKMGAAKAIRQLGGTVPSGYDLKLIADTIAGHRRGRLDATELQAYAELLAVQIAGVPASFWRPGP